MRKQQHQEKERIEELKRKSPTVEVGTPKLNSFFSSYVSRPRFILFYRLRSYSYYWRAIDPYFASIILLPSLAEFRIVSIYVGGCFDIEWIP